MPKLHKDSVFDKNNTGKMNSGESEISTVYTG